MYGFLIGDIIGNSYAHENESFNLKTKDFSLFTNRSKFSDDTILTMANIDWLLNTNKTKQELIDIIKKWYQKFPDKEITIYGKRFSKWVESGANNSPKNFGNGACMRVSPIGWYASSLYELKQLVELNVSTTHNTKMAVNASVAVASVIFLFRQGKSISFVKTYIEEQFGYPLNYEINKFREEYHYTSAAVGTVIASLLCVFQSNSFEDALRNAVSLGGDTDTITSITCAVAESVYGVPNKIVEQCLKFLPTEFIKLLKDFNLYLLENK